MVETLDGMNFIVKFFFSDLLYMNFEKIGGNIEIGMIFE